MAALEALPDLLAACDVVVSCTGSVGHVVGADDVRAAALARGGRPLVLVDLALPRDVEPLPEDLRGVVLVDLETLGLRLAADADGTTEVTRARSVVAGEVRVWRSEVEAATVTPTVVALRSQADAVVSAELDRLRGRLGDLDPAVAAEVERTVRRVVDKVLHTPTVRVKELAGGPDGSMYAEALQTLFGLTVADSLEPVASFTETRGETAPSERCPDRHRGPAVIRVGTRASALARTQSQLVADALSAALGEPAELVLVSTHGDRSSSPLRELARTTSGTGVFVSALREALLAGVVDVAVHSLKDLPTAPAPGIDLAAVPEREDPRDALVAVGGLRLADLPDGARVGTGSPRRAAMLLADAARRGRRLEVVDVRGNVDTRLARVGADLDAVVLALAGLRRLGRADEVTEVLEPDVLLPCPGQGALAVETRAGEPLSARVSGRARPRAHPRRRHRGAEPAARPRRRLLRPGRGLGHRHRRPARAAGGARGRGPRRPGRRRGPGGARPGRRQHARPPRALPGPRRRGRGRRGRRPAPARLPHRGDAADAEAIGTRAGHELLATRARQVHRTTSEEILR